MSKNRRIIVLLLICVFSLTGCKKSESNLTEKSENTTSSNKTTTQSDETKESTIVEVKEKITQESEQKSLWNHGKKQQLAVFMSKWGQEMGQIYQEYDERKPSNYAGLHFPQEFDRYQIAVNEVPVSVKWAPNGENIGDYNVVAVYCDVEGTVGGHLYLFTYHQNQPVVLITQQNQAMPDGMLHFTETQNQDLARGFREIANQAGSHQMSQAEPNEESMITYQEAKDLLNREGMIFSDEQGHLVEDNGSELTRGGNHVALDNGAILLRQYSGARGFEEYTLTPIPNNMVRIQWHTRTFEKGEVLDHGIAKDIQVVR